MLHNVYSAIENPILYMTEKLLNSAIEELRAKLHLETYYDTTHRILYATDASAYRELPLGVVYPKHASDIAAIVRWSGKYTVALIPRAAGTSLAGQVVGNGLVVDMSKYMTQIIEVNTHESWVRVQPGVVLDELNLYLKPYKLFFGPETSTANRCNLGGMVGNNSCGLHSLIYGSTRDHLLEVNAVLSDGSEVVFRDCTKDELKQKCDQEDLEGRIYKQIFQELSHKSVQERIRKEYPDREIHRRNTGYAIDLLLDTKPFGGDQMFNLCKLVAGSEGTLAFVTEIKLNLVPIPPKHKAVLCVHFKTIAQSLQANLVVLKHKPTAIELMDKAILDLTKGNRLQSQNRFFIDGDPGAILIIELVAHTKEEIDNQSKDIISDLKEAELGYHFPLLYDTDVAKVWNLRKAGLGVLSNMPGDAKPVSVVEDTAIRVDKLPAFIEEFDKLMAEKGKSCVYHAHIASGELHLRPIMNLKDQTEVKVFRDIAHETALLVKKYNGSLSGEHGDGRLRGEFINLMIGNENYDLLRRIKQTWDPAILFNPGKITDTPPMNTSLRYQQSKIDSAIETYFSWDESLGLLRGVERCNGSGDCRKTEVIGGTMCPSFMVTRDEKDTTRGRANILRDFLQNSTKSNPFNHKEIYDAMSLCLSCKACKSECPSSVDMAKLKAEFLQHYYNSNSVPLRTKIIANFPRFIRVVSHFSSLYNFVLRFDTISKFIKHFIGFAQARALPGTSSQTLLAYHKKSKRPDHKRKVWLFADEFTNYTESHIGIKAICLLEKLGYSVSIPTPIESGRTYLSKGFVKSAKKLANKNVLLLSELISAQQPLIGIEPSAILTFRDEYPQLVNADLKVKSEELAPNCLMIEEFLWNEMKAGNITKELFTKEYKEIRFHGHCYQKALTGTLSVKEILSFPENYTATEINSGCCGMAGSFGFEKEHYDISMKIGELVLFPEVRKTPEEVYLSASGTSCRHQIKDGTGREAMHPVEILFDALMK